MRIKASDEDFIKFSVNPTENGLIYSQYGIGLPILFIPFIIVAETVSLFIEAPQIVLTNFLISFYNIPFALLGLWFMKKILENLGVNKEQADATITIIATCTAYWHYTVSDFSEITQISFLLGCIYASIADSDKKWRYFSIWFSLLLSIKIAYLILLPVFFIYGLIDSRERKGRLLKDILNGSSFVLPFGIIIGILNYVRFGSFIEFGYGANPGFGFSLSNFIKVCIPSIFSFNYGIFPFNPILLFFPLWFKVYKNNRSFSLLIFAITGIWFLIMCSYSYGWGWSWGQRYLFVVVPLLALSVAYFPSIKLTRFVKAIVLLLILSSALIQLMSVSTKIHEPLTMISELKNKSKDANIGQLPSTFLLFKHKLLDGSCNYPLSIIGGDPNQSIDLSSYNSFQGFNYWPIHMLKFLNLKNYIRFVEIILLFVIFTLQFGLLKVYLPILLGKNNSLIQINSRNSK